MNKYQEIFDKMLSEYQYNKHEYPSTIKLDISKIELSNIFNMQFLNYPSIYDIDIIRESAIENIRKVLYRKPRFIGADMATGKDMTCRMICRVGHQGVEPIWGW